MILLVCPNQWKNVKVEHSPRCDEENANIHKSNTDTKINKKREKESKWTIEVAVIISRMSTPVEWGLYVVWRAWVEQIWVEFTVCTCKSIVLVGLAPVIPAEGGASRMTLSHMEEVLVRAAWGVTAVLTHKDLGTSLAVGVLLMDAVDLPHVRLQRTSLCEGFLAELTLVRADTCRGTHTELSKGAHGLNHQHANESRKMQLGMVSKSALKTLWRRATCYVCYHLRGELLLPPADVWSCLTV